METTATTTYFTTLLDSIQGGVVGTPLESPFLFSLVAIVLTILAAYVVKSFFRFLTSYVLTKSKIDVDDEIAKAIGRALFVGVIFAGFTIAFYVFISAPDIREMLIRGMLTGVLFYWTFVGIGIVRIIFTFLSRLKRAPLIKRETVPLFHNASAITIFILAFYLILSLIWQVNMTALIASLGVAGIAIGFAAKDTLANLFSGVFILADQPYKIGDYIVLGTGERGEVTAIGIRSTRMMTRDDVEITIPNSIMGNTSIVNESGGPYRKTRIAANVGVAYGSDIDRVRDVLLDIAARNDDVQKHPEARVRMRGFGASSVDFSLLTWVKEPADRGRTLDALYHEIYNTFKQEGIEIPYQKQDLYIKEMPDQRS